jgi:hypothetical protein
MDPSHYVFPRKRARICVGKSKLKKNNEKEWKKELQAGIDPSFVNPTFYQHH